MQLREHLHEHGVFLAGAVLEDRAKTVAAKRFKGNKQIADAVAFILVVLAPDLARFHRHWLNNVTDQLARALVQIDYWASWIIGQLMLMEHIFHVPNELRGYLTNAPHLSQMRLQLVFFKNLRTPSWEM